MVKKMFAKLTSLVLVVMLAFTMVPAGFAFAGTADYEFVVTADKASAVAGDDIIVSVTMNGSYKDLAGIQIGVVYDPTAASIDVTNTGSKKNPRYDNGVDEEWYDECVLDEDNHLGYAFEFNFGNKPYPGDTSKNISTIMYYSGKGYTIDSDCGLYNETTAVIAKYKFKALKNIDSVADTFALATAIDYLNVSVDGVGGAFTYEVKQIAKLDMTAVNNVNTLISAIPAAVTYADKAAIEAAKTAYAALGDAEKALVTGAEKITAAETAIAAIQTKIDNAKTLIDAIGDVIYPDSKAKIDAARDAYDALGADTAAKEAVTNYSKLTEAEAKYAELEQGALEEAENKAAAAKVDAKIEAIGTVAYTAASKALIDEAEAAYKALTSAQVGFVNNKTVLDKAIADYKALNDEVVAVNNALAALDASAVKLADKAALAELRQQYADLDDNQEAAILPANVEKLVACEAKIVELEARKARIDEVIAKINAIGNVELTAECKARIDAAKDAFDNLDDDSERDEVTNKDVLEAAEADYKALEDAAAENEANRQAAAAVDAKIEAIGTVAYTAASKALIDDADAAYKALTSAQQALVNKKGTLDNAKAEYKKLDDEVAAAEGKIKAFEGKTVTVADADDVEALEEALEALNADQTAALDARLGYSSNGKKDEYVAAYNDSFGRIKKVKNLILAIGTVTLESEDAIVTAEELYKVLLDVEKDYVTNYTTLVKAREDYNTLVTYKEAADEVVTAICALPSPDAVTKDNVDTVAAKAASAKTSYENLPDKTMVAAKYLEMLAAVEEACNVVKVDLANAKAVDNLIAAIGNVSLESLAKIEEAEAAYSDLNAMAQSYVTKKDILDEARATYNALKAEQDAIDAVEELIDAIGDVTLDSEDAIVAAETAYEELGELKNRVENIKTLTDARATYNELVASKARVDAVVKLIDELGEISLQSIAKIEAAERAYAALSEDEQGRVENYQTLLDARAAYNELKQNADKEAADLAAAEGVDSLIDAIGAIADITLESEDAIVAARNAYDALTEDQKALVAGLAVLEEAEDALEGLKLDKAAVDAVIAKINEIGEVTYPDSKDAIDAAKIAYDELADDIKGQVTNKGVLDAAIAKYEALEVDYNAVQNVIAKIEAIGSVEYTVECKERIDEANEAYLALREELRAEVTNADVLDSAKAEYEALKPTFKETDEVVTEYGNVNVIVYNNIPAGKKVTLGGFEAKMIGDGENTYYIIVTNDELNAEDVVVEEGTCETILMGDADGNGAITATDALAVNQKSANMDVAYYTNDAMAYVRTDINGSGTITAYDALMVARIAANIDVVINFVTGK